VSGEPVHGSGGDGAPALASGAVDDRLGRLEQRLQALECQLVLAPEAGGADGETDLVHGLVAGEAQAVRLEGGRQQVRARLADSARLMQTLLAESEARGQPGAPPSASLALGSPDELQHWPAACRAAVACVALGPDITAEMMKHLQEHEVEELAARIASLPAVPPVTMAWALNDFQRRLAAGEWVIPGGVAFARSALERALGPGRAREVLDRVNPSARPGIYMLRNVAADQVAPFLAQEHPQTIALMLSQLEPGQAAGILAQIPERLQADVAYRIATMENITPVVVRQIEESLEASLRDILGGNQDVGGPRVVAGILNLTGSSVEKTVLDQMDGQDPEVAESVRNLMFVFEDIAGLSQSELQTLLREVDAEDLAKALKAASADLKSRLLAQLPEDGRVALATRMEGLGPMRLSDVEEAQLRIVQQVRRLEEQGRVTIVRGGPDRVYV
jgi:flagellar motor switch protein FliG